MSRLALVVLIVSAASCDTASIHAASAAEHDRHAAQHERAADIVESQYEPDKRVEAPVCPRPDAQRADVYAGVCWTALVNPTAEVTARAAEHRRRAAAHRAASAALRGAEARACSGLAGDDRDTSPLARREDILSVEPFYRPRSEGESLAQSELAGAVVTFKAVPGLTAERLARLVDCHVARGAALGHDSAEMRDCPLAVRNVSAITSGRGEQIVVTISAADRTMAEEVLRRARNASR